MLQIYMDKSETFFNWKYRYRYTTKYKNSIKYGECHSFSTKSNNYRMIFGAKCQRCNDIFLFMALISNYYSDGNKELICIDCNRYANY